MSGRVRRPERRQIGLICTQPAGEVTNGAAGQNGGTDVSILLVVTPATQALTAGEAIALARERTTRPLPPSAASGLFPRVRDHADQRSAGCGRRTRTERHPAGSRRRDDPRTDGHPYAGRSRLRRPVRYRGPADERLHHGNIHITSSGMLQERLLRHVLDFTGADRVLFATDYPFHRPGAAAVEQSLDAIADPSDRSKIASGNAKALFRLAWVDAPGR
jgi:Amidohydrolase